MFYTGIYAPLTPGERVALDERLARNQKEFLDLTAQLNNGALISKLPDSVLLMVFAQYIEAWKEDIIDTHFIKENAHDFTSGRPYYGWIRLAHVCRRWRDIALRTPSLWTHLKVTSAEGADAFLERCGSSPIHVEGSMTAESFESAEGRVAWRRVFEEAHHMASLHVSFDEDFDKFPAEVGLGYPDFPRLKSLKLLRHGDNPDPVTILPRFIRSDQRFEGLEEFQATNYCLSLTAPLFIGCKNLTGLSLSGFRDKDVTWETLFDMLGRFPQLQRLTLRQGLPVKHLGSSNSLPVLLSGPISLPYLQELDVSSTTAGLDCAHLLQHLTVPPNATVRMAVGDIYVYSRFGDEEPPKIHDESLPFVANPLISWLAQSQASRDPIGSLYIDSFRPVPWIDRKYATKIVGYAAGTVVEFVRNADDGWKTLPRVTTDKPSRIETTWSSYTPKLILKEIATLPSFRKVEILVLGDIRSEPHRPTPADVKTWFQVFRHFTEVKFIRITGRTTRWFPHALATHDHKPSILFPKLNMIGLVRAVFVDQAQQTEEKQLEWFETLRKELVERQKRIRNFLLDIEDARNITLEQVEALEAFMNVEFDGRCTNKPGSAEDDEPWAEADRDGYYSEEYEEVAEEVVEEEE